MSEGQYFRFGGFAANLNTSWERLVFETRHDTGFTENLEALFNGEHMTGDKEQVDFAFR